MKQTFAWTLAKNLKYDFKNANLDLKSYTQFQKNTVSFMRIYQTIKCTNKIKI